MLQSVASADEGLYALVARELLRGHLPYTTVWETKPPLLFALLAGAFALFGTSMAALRIATDLAIFATSLALYAIGTSLPRDGRTVGLAAALLYAALTLSDSASSALAETFYAPFVAIPIAMALYRRRHRRVAGPLVASALGACLGCAVLVKESAVLEAVFAAIIIVRTLGARAGGPLLLGFVAAIAASVLPYAAEHELAAYWDANVSAVARRAFVAVTDATPLADVLRAQALAFFPTTLLAFGLPWFFRRDVSEDDERSFARFALAWVAVDLSTVTAIREYLGNHFIPLMAPAALLGALVAVALARRLGNRAFVPAVLAVGLLAHCAYQFVLAAPVAYARFARHDPTFGDPTAQLAAYIVSHAAPGTTLYVADDRTILYVLTGLAPPTRFAYSAHLVDRYQETIAGVSGAREIVRAFARHPLFVVRDLANREREDPPSRDVLDRALARAYRVAFARGARTIYVYDGGKS
ncbi:MAG: glycosyltransferase family 39 protein [Candidatus Eremiobacteraeota bacterium]|nr:glycosyltransferase family 39 protein [Candidatus Eremiobacteraeota bacterium]